MKLLLKRQINKIIIKLKFMHEASKLDSFTNNKNVSVESDLMIDEYFSTNLPADNFSIKLGAHVRFKKYCHILLFPKAELIIQANVFFNNYCSINCLDKISIGENTMFGEGVKIYDHNHIHTYTNNELKVFKDQFKTAPVSVGKNCWIGSNVTILKGVSIGNNVIIGANNLIYQSVPDNTVIKLKVDYFTDNFS